MGDEDTERTPSISEHLTLTEALLRCKDGIGAISHKSTSEYVFVLPDRLLRISKWGNCAGVTNLASLLEDDLIDATTEASVWHYVGHPTFTFSSAISLVKQTHSMFARDSWVKNAFLNRAVVYDPTLDRITIKCLESGELSDVATPLFSAEDVATEDWFLVPTQYVKLDSVSIPVYA